MNSILQEANELLPLDFNLKDVLPLPPPPGRFDEIEDGCGQRCQICGRNFCTLIYRRGDLQPNRHLCQDCDIKQFNDTIDAM